MLNAQDEIITKNLQILSSILKVTLNLFPSITKITDTSQVSLLYRYIRQQYVDDFFENGNLRFTTLYTCRSHEDLIRRDDQEGKSIFVARPDKDGNVWDKSHKNNIKKRI